MMKVTTAHREKMDLFFKHFQPLQKGYEVRTKDNIIKLKIKGFPNYGDTQRIYDLGTALDFCVDSILKPNREKSKVIFTLTFIDPLPF